MVTIHLNGERRDVPEGLRLAAVLEWLRLPADRIAVERNLEIVPRHRWPETPIESGDRLEVVHFVGGGQVDEDRLGLLQAARFPATAFCDRPSDGTKSLASSAVAAMPLANYRLPTAEVVEYLKTGMGTPVQFLIGLWLITDP